MAAAGAVVMSAFEEKLRVASVEWVGAGLITDEQRAAILARHPAKEGSGGRFIGIVATVGGLLFAVGVSLVIKANWESLGDWTKIGGLVALLVGSNVAGWKLKLAGEHLPKTGDACLMIGGIFFLCGIALVSQIFHLNSRPATGLLVWWAGIVVVPWLTGSKGAQFLSIVAGLAWLGYEMVTPGSWIEIASRASGYGHDPVGVVAVFVFLGLGLWMSGLGMRGTRRSDFAGMHEKWGVVLTFGALYWLGFTRHAWGTTRHGLGRFDASSLLAIGLGLLLAAVGLAAAWRRSGRETRTLLPWIAFACVPALGVFSGPLGDGGWLWSALAWLALFVLCIGTVRVGLEAGRESWVNLGILGIAINVVTRYFDLFGSILEGGVFFILSGIIVTALGIFLERKRRVLLNTLRQELQP
jgi:hypothetical protein